MTDTRLIKHIARAGPNEVRRIHQQSFTSPIGCDISNGIKSTNYGCAKLTCQVLSLIRRICTVITPHTIWRNFISRLRTGNGSQLISSGTSQTIKRFSTNSRTVTSTRRGMPGIPKEKQLTGTFRSKGQFKTWKKVVLLVNKATK